jgi:protein-tyrosine phosphatase
MAEAILRHQAAERGIEVEVESAGTGGWHAGEGADPRTVETLRRQGIECPGSARQLTSEDFQDFDLLIAMDEENLRAMQTWPGAKREKIRLFCPGGIGDPYYGGPRGFDRMYDQIRDGCRNILDSFESKS